MSKQKLIIILCLFCLLFQHSLWSAEKEVLFTYPSKSGYQTKMLGNVFKDYLSKIMAKNFPNIGEAHLTDHLFPSVKLEKSSGKMIISLGTLGMISSEDELLFLMAREAGDNVNREWNPLLDSYSLNHGQKEEIIKDIKGVNYLIDKGYNPLLPLKYFDYLSPFIKKIKDDERLDEIKELYPLKHRPNMAIRRAILKHYVEQLGFYEKDLSKHVKKEVSLPDDFSFRSTYRTIGLLMNYTWFAPGIPKGIKSNISWALDSVNSYIPLAGTITGIVTFSFSTSYVLCYVVAPKALTVVQHANRIITRRIDNPPSEGLKTGVFSIIASLGLATAYWLSTELYEYTYPKSDRQLYGTMMDRYKEILDKKDSLEKVNELAKFFKTNLIPHYSSSYYKKASIKLRHDCLNEILRIKDSSSFHFSMKDIFNSDAVNVYSIPLTILGEETLKLLTRLLDFDQLDPSDYENTLLYDEEHPLTLYSLSLAYYLSQKSPAISDQKVKFKILQILNLLPDNLEYIMINALNQNLREFFLDCSVRSLSYQYYSFMINMKIELRGDIKNKLISILESEDSLENKIVLYTTLRESFAWREDHDNEQNYWFSQKGIKDLERSKIIDLALKKFTSLKSLTDFIDERISSFNLGSFYLGDILSELIISNPKLITNFDDIKVILNKREFWSTEVIKRNDLSDDKFHEKNQKIVDHFQKRSLGYNSEHSEKLHALMLKRLEELNIMPENSLDIFDLWEYFILRGETFYSDQLFKTAYEKCDNEEVKRNAREIVLKRGSIFDKKVLTKIVRDEIFESNTYRQLVNSKIASKRNGLIKELIGISRKALGAGILHSEILEELSRKIKSSEEESEYIEKQKYADIDDLRKDQAIEFLSSLSETFTNWSLENQWDLITYLLGHKDELGEKISNFFLSNSITPLRVKMMFNYLPFSFQSSILDGLLGHAHGILHPFQEGIFKTNYTKVVTNHLLSMTEGKTKEVAADLLQAYLYALEKVGLKELKSNVFSNLLLTVKKGNGSPELLTRICEAFGATGVKIGQFLMASGVLPEEENLALSRLHDKSRIPNRFEIYQDLRSIFSNVDLHDPLPYVVDDVIGAASLKYVLKVHPLENGEEQNKEIVLKILRKDAMAHTTTEAEQLSEMAQYLVDTYGAKYYVLKAAVRAANQAVSAELSLKDEVRKSNYARMHMYDNCAHTKTVKERLISDRLIEADLAQGSNILGLKSEEHQNLSTQYFLTCESKNYLESKDGVLSFDPDRHPGNILYASKTDTLYPLDFGQLQIISEDNYQDVIQMFSFAQILSRTTYGNYLKEQIVNILSRYEGFSNFDEQDLKEVIKNIFPNEDLSPFSAYYTLLAGIDSYGPSKLPIFFYDYARGLIQLSQYEKFLDDSQESVTPKYYFEKKVKETIDQHVQAMKQ